MWQAIDPIILSLPAEFPLRLMVFILVLSRFSGLFLVAPFFGAEAVPMHVRAAAAVLFSVCVTPLVPLPAAATLAWFEKTQGMTEAAALVAVEVGIGLIFGLAVSLFFAAVQFAGQVLGQQVGYALANVLDPVSNTEVSVLGQLYYLFAVGVFIASNLHLELVGVLWRSFDLVPLGAALNWPRVGELLVLGMGGTMWQFGVRVALPVMLGLFLVAVGLGFLSRAVPEINVFIVGFGLKALVGLWLLYLCVPLVVDLFREGLHLTVRDAAGLLTWVRSG